MLGIDLSALSHAQLARLMEVSQAKGQGEMTAELRRELARRGASQPATAMTWPPPSFEHVEPAAGLETTGEAAPRRMAAVVAVVLAALTASGAAGWWLTRAPTPAPAAAAPPQPAESAPPAAAAAPASIAAPAPAPPARAAAHARHHAASHVHRHHARRRAPPHPRHGLIHRLASWLKPKPARS